MRTCKVMSILLFLILPALAVLAAEPLALPRLQGPIHLDGLSDEPA